MDFREVCAFFGGSIFHEDFRCDLDIPDFKNRLDNLERPEGATDADNLPICSLLGSIAMILRGHVEDAENIMISVFHMTQDERWRQRLKGYLKFAMTMKFYPPLFRYRPQVSGPTRLFDMIENPELAPDLETALKENISIMRTLKDDEPIDLHVLEQSLLYTIWNFNHSALSASQAINSNFRCEDLQTPVPSLEQRKVVVSTLAVLHGLRTICDMMEADRALCGPFSSPIALNLPLVENWTVGPSNFPVGKASSLLQLGYDGTIEYDLTDTSMSPEVRHHQTIRSDMVATNIAFKTYTTEGGEENGRASIHWERVSPENTEFLADETLGSTAFPAITTNNFVEEEALKRAERLYCRAEALMRKSNSLRGVAAVQLRQACAIELARMARQDTGQHTTSEELIQLLKEISTSFRDSGDATSWYLTLLLNTLAGDQTSVLTHENLADLDVLEEKSGTFGQCLGLLALRYGDFYQYRRGSMMHAFCGYLSSCQILYRLARREPKRYRHLATTAHLSGLSQRLQFGWQQVPRHEIFSIYKGLIELAKSVPLTVGDGASLNCEPLAWSVVFLIEDFVQSIVELSVASGTFTQDEETSLSSIVGQVTPHLGWLPGLASYLGQMNHRYKLTIDYLRLRSQWHRSTFEGTVQDLEETRRSLQALARSSLEMKELWPSTISLCGQISAESAYHFMASESSSILGAIDPWPNKIAWSVFGSEWFTAYGRFIAVEQTLEGAVAMKNWPYAQDLMQILNRLAPGYLSSDCCASKIPSWRRMLLAALVEDGSGMFEDAIRLSMMACVELSATLVGEFGDVDGRSAFLSNPDVSRAPNLCAKLLIRALERGHDLAPEDVSSTPPRRSYRNKLAFPQGRPLLDGIESYAWWALFYLEDRRATSLYEQFQFGADVSESRRKLLNSRYEFLLMRQLKLASRPLSTEEQYQLDVLESSQEDLVRNRIGPNDPTIENFMTKREDTEPIENVLNYIPGNSLVIYTALSTEGLTAIALCWQGICKAVFFEETNLQQFGTTVAIYLATVRDAKEAADSTALTKLSDYLSEFLIDPFEEFVELADHIIFVPSGPLTQFPLGTLLFKKTALVTQKAVSQVPSLLYLKYVVKRPRRHEKYKIAVVARPGSVREEALGGERALPLAGIEAGFVSGFRKDYVRKAQDVLRRDLDELLDHPIVHIVTHGYIDASAPLLSRISLGEPTRVVDIFGSPSRADVVIFSACNTATGLQSPGENFTGFSQAILAAGADLFIGSLWPTDDLATMLHMFYFYNDLHDGLDENIATTWHRATARLVSTTTELAQGILEFMIEVWGRMEQDGRTPDHVVKNGREKLKRPIKRLEEGAIDLRHPYFWAPFILCGYSEVRVRVQREKPKGPAFEKIGTWLKMDTVSHG